MGVILSVDKVIATVFLMFCGVIIVYAVNPFLGVILDTLTWNDPIARLTVQLLLYIFILTVLVIVPYLTYSSYKEEKKK